MFNGQCETTLSSPVCCPLNISFDPFTWSIPNFVQGLHPCLVHISNSFEFCTKGGIYVFKTFLVFNFKDYLFHQITLKCLQITINLRFHVLWRCCTNNKWPIFKNQMKFFSCRHFEINASPSQPSMEASPDVLKNFKLGLMEIWLKRYHFGTSMAVDIRALFSRASACERSAHEQLNVTSKLFVTRWEHVVNR